jgi:hypothetical protein
MILMSPSLSLDSLGTSPRAATALAGPSSLPYDCGVVSGGWLGPREGVRMLLEVDMSAALAESSVPGWDGEGAEPASEESMNRAMELLRAMVASCPVPTFCICPDGDFALTWGSSERSNFTVVLSASGAADYAGIDEGGAWSGHLSSMWSGEGPAPEIFSGIRRIGLI